MKDPVAMAGVDSKETVKLFDVFLSHNSKDKPDVKRVGEALKKRGISVWLDEWELRPGHSWQEGLEHIVTTCKSAAVFVGENRMGPWEDPEMKALLRRFVEEKKSGNVVPVIPILLPNAPDGLKLPLFLEEFTWVDLRDGVKKDGLDRLVWGITGTKPNPS
ncbi:MAG TPA: toll/interleukin-1 receptor domain-containing protein [Fuerstia sp.]|nr:toll/interleukin-1 receptor domain-containing protein [Fuerstiella sp.]